MPLHICSEDIGSVSCKHGFKKNKKDVGLKMHLLYDIIISQDSLSIPLWSPQVHVAVLVSDDRFY